MTTSSLFNIFISDPSCLVAEVGIVVHFEDRGWILVPMRTSVALHTRRSETVRHHITSNAGLAIGDCLTAAFEAEDDELYHEHFKALFDGIVNSDGRMGGYRVRDVVLYVTLLKDGKIPATGTYRDGTSCCGQAQEIALLVFERAAARTLS